MLYNHMCHSWKKLLKNVLKLLKLILAIEKLKPLADGKSKIQILDEVCDITGSIII